MSLVIGLTGGIGSGKSAVASIFEELGASIVDTDAIAHQLTGPGGEAMAPIRAAFGSTVIDPRGVLDRAAMRHMVFADKQARVRLEAILHPMIRLEAERQSNQAQSRYVVLVVPLLVETGAYRERIGRIVVVDCPEDVQVARVMARSGLSEDETRAILAAQASRAVRLAMADDVIDNGGERTTLFPQVQSLHDRYLKMTEGS